MEIPAYFYGKFSFSKAKKCQVIPHFGHESNLSHVYSRIMDSHRASLVKIQMRHLRQEIRFQQAIFNFFQNFIFSTHRDSSDSLHNTQAVLEEEADPIEEARKDLSYNFHILDMEEGNLVVARCLETIDMEEGPENLKDFCLEMLHRFLHGSSSGKFDTSKFILYTLMILKILGISKPDVIAPVEKQMGRLEKLLEFVFTITWATEQTNIGENVQSFLEHIQPWVTNAAAIPFVLWVDKMDEKLCALLSTFIMKFNPRTPKLVEIYLGAVKDLKLPKESEESEESKESEDFEESEEPEESEDLSLASDESEEPEESEDLSLASDESEESEDLPLTSDEAEEPEESSVASEEVLGSLDFEESENSEDLKEPEELKESEELEERKRRIQEFKYLLGLEESEESEESLGSEESQESNVLLMRNALWRFIDIVLENLTFFTDGEDDCFKMLRGTLIFFTALLLDPPAQTYAEDEKLTLTHTNLLVGEAASLICNFLCLDKFREDNAEERNVLLRDLQEKIQRAKTELRPLHDEIPGLSWNNVPETNRRGFFDFLLRNLKKKFEAEAKLFPFEKHLIEEVQKELLFCKPFLMDIFELQDEHEELKDIWVRAGNVAYLVDHVTDSLLSFDIPIWSNLMHLSKAMEQIQSVNTEVEKIKKSQMYNKIFSSAKTNSQVILPEREQANDTISIVGFTTEKDKCIDQLLGGLKARDIVAIVGMGGQGKTTLAQRVFCDERVQTHFLKRGQCCISQSYDIKLILLDILKDIGSPVSEREASNVSEHDLANLLRKCLRGLRYLVFLDDIWDVEAWNRLKLSFPDESNGSRILLTSRNHNVPLEAKPDCCIVKPRPLSSEESWNLLQLKVFEEGDDRPENLSNIGKKIANNCKGLPLAIVVVAGLLKKDKNVDSWENIAESLQPQIASKGCMEILELSYNHLPDILKPCFLYLAAFQEDEAIDTKKLIQLWIAEGFVEDDGKQSLEVEDDGKQSLEVVAYKYLADLVDRSLVLIARRTSLNGIRTCRVHDLLHEFCLIKAKEERLLLVSNISNHSSTSTTGYVPYRLCVRDTDVPFVDSKPMVQSLRSLFFALCGGEQFYFGSASLFTKFKLLRVLNLERAVSYSDFHKITQLIHLQFLSIFYGCEFMPPSIANLLRLEVLRLRTSFYAGNLTSTVMKMTNLRHVKVGSNYRLHLDDSEDVDHLKRLETFTEINFTDAGTFEKVAPRLPNVRKLGIGVKFAICLKDRFSKLESLKLKMECKYSSGFTFYFPSTLKKLSLEHFRRLPENTMPLIGELSNLEVLKITARLPRHRRWNVKDDEFLRLRYLRVNFLNIEEWSAEEESFPCLEQLHVLKCGYLRDLPGRFGQIPTLKTIKAFVVHERMKSSFQQIVDEQKDTGNEVLQYSISYMKS